MAPSAFYRSQHKLWTLRVMGLLLSLAVPFFASAQEFKDPPNLDLEVLRPAMQSALETPEYQVTIKLIRQQFREGYLGEIYRQYRENPDLKLGALPLKELFQGLEKFNVFQNITNLGVLGDPQRESDFYIPGEFWGIFNTPPSFSASDRVKVLLFFHVFLGSAGFDDENYQLTLTLLLYNQVLKNELRHPDPSIQEANILSLFPQTEKELYLKKGALRTTQAPKPLPPNQILIAEGGFTGVGRGGDSRSVKVKLLMTEYMYAVSNLKHLPKGCRDTWSNATDYLKDVLSVEIESTGEIEHNEIRKSDNGDDAIYISKVNINNKKYWETLSVRAIHSLCEIKLKTRR